MFAVPFDLDARETRGTAVPVLNDIAYDPAASLPQYGISADGTLVYRATAARGRGPPASCGSMRPASGTRCRAGPLNTVIATSVSRRQAPRADGQGWRESGHLGLRHRTRSEDAPDVWH